MSEIRAISHHIGGEYWSGQSDRTGDVYNPATGKITGKVDFASVSVIDHAVDVATRAQQEWRNASIAKRVQVLFAFREIVNARKEKIAKLITAEHGKVLSDALGEVTRGLEGWKCSNHQAERERSFASKSDRRILEGSRIT